MGVIPAHVSSYIRQIAVSVLGHALEMKKTRKNLK
jgi:hypothetical protein